MPIYKNIGNNPIHLDKDRKIVQPNEEITTKYFYRIDNLQLIDIHPYLTPCDITEKSTCSNTNIKEYDIFDKKVLIIAIDGDIQIHLNEYPSSNVLLAIPGMKYEFSNINGVIDKIYLSADSNTTYFIAIYNPEYVNV